ncbi:MAG: ABC transporter permease [Gemmatimonadota bacterium]
MTLLPAGFRRLLRRLARSPGFTLLSLLTVALGIGANAAVYAVVHSVLLEPLPYPAADRLVAFHHTAPALNFDEALQSPATYFTYREESRSFTDVGVWLNGQATITGIDRPERVATMRVTDGTLPILGAAPAIGRTFSAADDRGDASPVVLLSHRYWATRLGADPAVVGRILRVNGRPMEIIGVMPEGFRFMDRDPLLYLPFRFERSELTVSDFSYNGIARLRDGVTIDAALADARRVLPLTFEKFSGGLQPGMLLDAGFTPVIVPLKDRLVGPVRATLWVILGTVGLVLLIGCANVANLFLVRADGRLQESAVRRALGGTRGSVARSFMGESLVLSLAGGGVGLLLAGAGLQAFRAWGPGDMPRLAEVAIDANVVLVTLAIALFTGLFFGIMPLFRAGTADLMATLREGGRGGGDGRERGRVRGALVVGQVALALILLVGSGLMIRTYRALQQVDPGFADPATAQTARIMVPWSDVPDDATAALRFERILAQVEQVPGIERAAFSTSLTMDGWSSADAVWFEDFPAPVGELPPIRRFKYVSPGYFAAMGNPVKAGRDYTWDDIRGRRPVVVISENLARELWGSADAAIGRRLKDDWDASATWREIVGVVGDIRDDGVDRPAVPTVFWPYVVADFRGHDLYMERSMGFVVRTTRAGTAPLLDALRSAVWVVDSDLPLANVRTLEDIVADSMARSAFTLAVLAAAGALALVLGIVGIYGVTSYTVALRRRELGVRMALGARGADITTLVLHRGVRQAGLGILIGFAGAVALTRLMQSLLYGVSPLDPLTYAGVALLLLVTAAAAGFVPARRAARTDPLVVLRED